VSAAATEFDQRRFLLLVVLAGAGFGMTAPLTVLYAESFGASDTMAGIAVSSIAITLLVIDVFGTKLVPRIDGRTTISMSLVVFGLGSIGQAVSNQLWQLIATRMFQGFGAAFFMGGALQVVVRFAPPGKTGRAIGQFNAAWFGGVAVGPLAGGLIAASGDGQTGYRAAFVVCGGICFVVAVAARLFLVSLPSLKRPRVTLPRRPRAVPGMRLWPPLVLASLGQLIRGGLMYTVIPLLGTRELGLTTVGVGIGMSAMAAVDLAAMRFGGALADEIGRRSVLTAALICGCATALLAPAVHDVATFSLWCAALGIVGGVTWVVPVALVVDVSEEPEDGLAAYRIGADVGQLGGPAGAGAAIAALGVVSATMSFGVGFAALAAWIVRLPETARRRPSEVTIPALTPRAGGSG
jgi:MFS family permease